MTPLLPRTVYSRMLTAVLALLLWPAASGASTVGADCLSFGAAHTAFWDAADPCPGNGPVPDAAQTMQFQSFQPKGQLMANQPPAPAAQLALLNITGPTEFYRALPPSAPPQPVKVPLPQGLPLLAASVLFLLLAARAPQARTALRHSRFRAG